MDEVFNQSIILYGRGDTAINRARLVQSLYSSAIFLFKGVEMPKGRMLNKKISLDVKIAELSLKAMLLFTWMIPYQDVKGRLITIPETIKGLIIPLCKYISVDEVPGLLNEMVESGLLVLYGSNNMYGQMLGFYKNQKVDTNKESPTEIPDYSGVTPELLQSYSGVTPELLRSYSRVTPEQLCTKFKEKFKRKSKNKTNDTADKLTNVSDFDFKKKYLKIVGVKDFKDVDEKTNANDKAKGNANDFAKRLKGGNVKRHSRLISEIHKITGDKNSDSFWRMAIDKLGEGIVEQELGELKYKLKTCEVKEPGRYFVKLLKSRITT